MRGCGFVDDASATHQGTCRGQLFELPTARPFAHKLHSHLLRLKQRSQNPENQHQPTINARNTSHGHIHRNHRSRSPEYALPETDEKFSVFVGDAENAFSREHTQWVARKDV